MFKLFVASRKEKLLYSTRCITYFLLHRKSCVSLNQLFNDFGCIFLFLPCYKRQPVFYLSTISHLYAVCLFAVIHNMWEEYKCLHLHLLLLVNCCAQHLCSWSFNSVFIEVYTIFIFCLFCKTSSMALINQRFFKIIAVNQAYQQYEIRNDHCEQARLILLVA